MADRGRRRGFRTNDGIGSIQPLLSNQQSSSNPTLSRQNTSDTMRLSTNFPTASSNEERTNIQPQTGVVRHSNSRNHHQNARHQATSSDHHQGVNHFDGHNTGQRQRPTSASFPKPKKLYSSISFSKFSSAATSRSSPPIKYGALSALLDKQPDEILSEMFNPNFQLEKFLQDARMRTNYDWTLSITRLFEKILECTGSRERVAHILQKLPNTLYIEGVYEAVREPDPITDQLRFDFINSFLNIYNEILLRIPHSIGDLTKVLERIELILMKVKNVTPEYEDTKNLLNEVLKNAEDIASQHKNRQQKVLVNTNIHDTTLDKDKNPENNYIAPPDDYRLLQIIPGLQEILSGRKVFLQENIVKGVYQDAQHYLDVHFRLLREDFVGPLRDGIEQYLKKTPGKNFNVRIYENVHSFGPRLCKQRGIVYDLQLSRDSASKIYWTNSRRLIYGNLLLLTYDKFQSYTYVTVEDRTNIEKKFVVSVKPLENYRLAQDIQFNLEDIDDSYELTMIETTTYFEAYRPVLKALQIINVEEPMPLEPFIVKLANQDMPPDYVTPMTRYDFTPLLVDPNSGVQSQVVSGDATRANHRLAPLLQQITRQELQITYREAHHVASKYKAVNLLDINKWPTSEELHLNPKQREALFLALTHKVALIQGPPGTGKTFLGVRIAEMLLHNRMVWCPTHEQSTPILMICQTNHALDQFLELIVKRLKIDSGIVRVGNRCKNASIMPFSIINARKRVRETRSIPKPIYTQKYAIMDKKTEAEESLKIHADRLEESFRNIMPLSLFRNFDIISEEHLVSLLSPYNDEMIDTVLFDWLGITYQDTEDFISTMGADESTILMTELNIDEDQHRENESSTEDNNNNAQNIVEEENEEEEEEERRRDEIETDEDFMYTTRNARTTMFTSIGSEALLVNEKDDTDTNEESNNGENEWKLIKRRPADRRRLIRSIMENPTTLTDQTAQAINSDLWKLPFSVRRDLYRYWISKYRRCLQQCSYEARQSYNQAMAALVEYHQDEDYYIMKDSIIVAMTTTCAAKYHNILGKLQNKIVLVEEAAAIFEAHIVTALSRHCQHLILIGDHVQLRPSPSVYRLATKYHIDVSLFERLIKNNFPNVRLNIQHRMRPEIACLMKHFYDDLENHKSVTENRPSIQGVSNNIYFINHSNLETAVSDGSSKQNVFESKYAIALALYLRKQGYEASQITILTMYLGQRQLIAKEAKNIKLLHGVHITVTDNYQGEENDIIILSLVRSNLDKKIGFLKIHNRICVALSRARFGLFIIGNMKLLAEVETMWQKMRQSLISANEIGSGLPLFCVQHSKDKFIADKPESFLCRPEGGCNKPCDARLSCGHQCRLMCHNYDVKHQEIKCVQKCNSVLPCGHSCTKRCHGLTPNQHDVCRVLVDKTVQQCGHTIKFQCARTPIPNDCQQPVPQHLPCGHAVNVPCSITLSPSELKRFSCPSPCNTMLSCGHKCAGRCGTCRNGQLHIPCQEKCDRPLICSHVCKESCASNCPPCRRSCEVRCVHSKCRKSCSELCTPCKEPCAYKCPHLTCHRLCSEPCDRGPCNEPCPKTLKCRHPCIGICGEPCPRQCRICNKHVVQEIFFGTEDEPDARFVFLPDCRHIIEVTALDSFIENSLSNESERKALQFPECPRCKQPIRRCIRYSSIINKVHTLIARVKSKILGNHSEVEINQRRNNLREHYGKTLANLKNIEFTSKSKSLFDTLNDGTINFNDAQLVFMENTLTFINEIDKILCDANKRLPNNLYDDLVLFPLRHITNYIFQQPDYRNFAEQQINDIQAELNRIRRLICIEAILVSLKQRMSAGGIKATEKAYLDTMKNLTNKPGPFTKSDEQSFDSLLEKIKHLNTLPGLGITNSERLEIVGALNLTKGHWFVCPKGHPYVITECGGASQESTCPDCGEAIGGQSHRLLPSNRHFGLMDDSQYAAWSDDANMNIIRHV